MPSKHAVQVRNPLPAKLVLGAWGFERSCDFRPYETIVKVDIVAWVLFSACGLSGLSLV